MDNLMSGRVLRALAPRSRARFAMALAAAGLFSLACDVHGPSEPGGLATMTVSPNPQTLAVGGTQQFVATGTDFSGANVAFTPTWSVAAGGGTISPTGVFTAGTVPGTFANTVTATSGGISARATVVVVAGALATITVTPLTVTLATGATQAYTAAGKDASGNAVAITPSWSVVAGGGTINLSSGLFTAGNTAGAFPGTVRASVGAIAGLADVTVTAGALATVTVSPNPQSMPVGTTQQFTQVGRDASGNVIAGPAVWTVEAGGGTISATGLFTATTTGTFTNTIKALRGTISGFATVTVTPVLATITVSPNPDSLQANGTQQFSAVGRDGNGAVFPITPVWSVANGGGTINATGLFTAGPTTGTFANTVTATSGTVSGTATVVVTPVITTITVTPNPDTLQVNTTQQFTAVARDANGVIQPSAITWSVVNGGGSIGSTTGLFTAGLAAGTFVNTIKATSGTTSGFATVTVQPNVTPIVALGAAAPNGIMAGQAFTCVNLGVINADIAISPGSTVTGFPPCVITGTQNLANPIADQAQIDLTTAYNTLAGLPCPPANAIVANLGGTTKPAGVYCTASGIGVTGVLTLDGGGDPNATFVFQAGSGLTTAGDIVLINSAQARNVYWQVGTSATIGTASQWQGNIIALTSITLVDNANLTGRALARNGSVSLGTGNVITLP